MFTGLESRRKTPAQAGLLDRGGGLEPSRERLPDASRPRRASLAARRSRHAARAPRSCRTWHTLRGAVRPARPAQRPVRPTSPNAARPSRTGAPRAAEATARQTARSAPGSSIRRPPATFTKTSACPSASPPCRESTATIIASRLGSSPVATRRGIARSVCDTSAWISSRIGRVPSSVQATAEPTSPGCPRPKSSDGSGTPVSPAAVISKIPISFVEPKRFFAARRTRCSR